MDCEKDFNNHNSANFEMKYSDIKKHIHIKNKNLLKFLNKQEIVWLEKHFKFINGLLMDRIKIEKLNTPSSNFKRYKDFVAVIRKEKEPTTDEENIYLKFTEYFQDEINKKNIKPKDPNILFNGVQINPTGSIPYSQEMSEKLDAEYEVESYNEWVDDWKYR